jgi:hypothetical protein
MWMMTIMTMKIIIKVWGHTSILGKVFAGRGMSPNNKNYNEGSELLGRLQ